MEIGSLNRSMAIHQSNVPAKIIKVIYNTFWSLLCAILTNVSLLKGFLKFSKLQMLNQFLRNNLEFIKKITGLSVFYPYSLKISKD